MANDSHLIPPDECRACEKYYAYKDGLCWECWNELMEGRAEQKEMQRQLERMECDDY